MERTEHNKRLQEVLQKCEKAVLTLNEKCAKISAIANMPEPRNVEEVRRFMGMVIYAGKFSPSLPALTKPLRDVFKNDSTCTWNAQQRTAFEKI